MADIEFDIDVDEDGISEKLEEAIESGIENTAEDLGDQGTKVAKDKITKEGAIWSTELLDSFNDFVEERNGTTFLVVENTSDHAGPQEHGVEPLAYADGGPPIQNLLPWVRTELAAWKVEQGWADYVVDTILGGSGNFPGYSNQEIAKGYWLHRKIKTEGLEPVRFMATAKRFIKNNGDYVTKRNIAKSLRKHGFL